MSSGLRIAMAILVVAELVRAALGARAGDSEEVFRGLALAVFFGFLAAGVTSPRRGSAAWYLMWGAAAVALIAVVAGFFD